MTKFKAFPELVIGDDMDGKPIIHYANGDTFLMGDMASIQRLIDCWNACRKLLNPTAHIEATDEYVARLETLRKEAWARAVELGANDFRPSAPSEMERAS